MRLLFKFKTKKRYPDGKGALNFIRSIQLSGEPRKGVCSTLGEVDYSISKERQEEIFKTLPYLTLESKYSFKMFCHLIDLCQHWYSKESFDFFDKLFEQLGLYNLPSTFFNDTTELITSTGKGLTDLRFFNSRNSKKNLYQDIPSNVLEYYNYDKNTSLNDAEHYINHIISKFFVGDKTPLSDIIYKFLESNSNLLFSKLSIQIELLNNFKEFRRQGSYLETVLIDPRFVSLIKHFNPYIENEIYKLSDKVLNPKIVHSF